MKTLTVLIILTFSLLSCKSNPVSSEEKNDFAIYLTKDTQDNFPDSVPLEKLVLETEPILNTNKLESYEWNSHTIIFSDKAKEAINEKGSILGRNFVVIAEKQRIYWGRFMSDVFSMSCQNPVIKLLPNHPELESSRTNIFIIDRAYPSYIGNVNNTDLRNDVKIYNVLKYYNKLK